MKKVLYPLTSVMLVAALAACGTNTPTRPNTQAQSYDYQVNRMDDTQVNHANVTQTGRDNVQVYTDGSSQEELRQLASKVSKGVQTQAKTGNASPRLLTPTDHSLMLVDHQPQMAFATKSHSMETVLNNVTGTAKAAKLFGVPTVLTTVASKTFSGSIFPQIQKVFPDQAPIDRTTMNAWEDQRVVDKVNSFGKKKLVIAGLWTEVCVVDPVLSAIDAGYQVYVITDASGGVTTEAHEMAVQRMVQAGAVPITWLQYLLEMQRDWANQKTYNDVLTIAKDHGGAYGLGVLYAGEMFGAKEGSK